MQISCANVLHDVSYGHFKVLLVPNLFLAAQYLKETNAVIILIQENLVFIDFFTENFGYKINGRISNEFSFVS